MNLLGFHNLFKVPKDAMKCEQLYFIILVNNLKMPVMSNVLVVKVLGHKKGPNM